MNTCVTGPHLQNALLGFIFCFRSLLEKANGDLGVSRSANDAVVLALREELATVFFFDTEIFICTQKSLLTSNLIVFFFSGQGTECGHNSTNGFRARKNTPAHPNNIQSQIPGHVSWRMGALSLPISFELLAANRHQKRRGEMTYAGKYSELSQIRGGGLAAESKVRLSPSFTPPNPSCPRPFVVAMGLLIGCTKPTTTLLF